MLLRRFAVVRKMEIVSYSDGYVAFKQDYVERTAAQAVQWATAVHNRRPRTGTKEDGG